MLIERGGQSGKAAVRTGSPSAAVMRLPGLARRRCRHILAGLVWVTSLGAPFACTAINDFDDVTPKETKPQPCASPCELVSQCGCEDGLMCAAVSIANNSLDCIVTGDDGLGQTCTSGTCAPGLHCSRIDTSPLTCRRWCETDQDCEGGSCNLTIGDAGLRLCGDVCLPIENTGCTVPMTKCTALNGGTVCAALGELGEGEPCEGVSDCAASLSCSGSETDPDQRCRLFCYLNGPACAPGYSCRAFVQPVVVEGQVLGACFPDSS